LVGLRKSRCRCDVEIAACILSAVAKRPMKKTWIMYTANLNHRLLRKHLERLLERGFLVQVDSGVYELTKGGRTFLDEYAKFKRLEDDVTS